HSGWRATKSSSRAMLSARGLRVGPSSQAISSRDRRGMSRPPISRRARVLLPAPALPSSTSFMVFSPCRGSVGQGAQYASAAARAQEAGGACYDRGFPLREMPMEALSHALLGAAIGQCALGRQLGNRALVAGGAVALVPDIDVPIGHLLGDAAALTFHRGITHSLLFAALAALVLGALLARWMPAPGWRRWALVCGGVLASHLTLDAFTSYGIQLLLPFSDHSVALASISVIDPLYTLPL